MINYDDIFIASIDPEYFDIEKTFAHVANADNEADKMNMTITIIKTVPADAEVSLFRFNDIIRIIKSGNRLIF